MPDPNVREIQLGGKQLVFLFMASVVLAVAIFLLGISVGRGVGAPATDAASEATAGSPVPPVEMPPATKTTPEDLAYHDKLQEQTAPKPQAPPPDATPKPAAAPATDTTSVPVSPPRSQASAPAPSSTIKPSAAKPTTPAARGQSAGSGWFVQVAAFKSRENADKQVSQLKAKGYSAVVQADPGSLFRVRIGPFQERNDAAATAERLQREENIRASVGR
jgi:DedD protein